MLKNFFIRNIYKILFIFLFGCFYRFIINISLDFDLFEFKYILSCSFVSFISMFFLNSSLDYLYCFNLSDFKTELGNINFFRLDTSSKSSFKTKVFWYTWKVHDPQYKNFMDFKNNWDPSQSVRKEMLSDIKKDLRKLKLVKNTLLYIFIPGRRK